MKILEQLRECLVVSCQPVTGGPLDRADIIAAFALAAMDGGAKGLRIEGVENIRAVRRVTSAPIIGLVKQDLAESPVRITPYSGQVREIVSAGADIVAFDATDRVRPEPVSRLLDTVHAEGALAMADCACEQDARRAADEGCDVLGSTMSGYTGGMVPEGPDLKLVETLSSLGRFTIAEGRYQQPEDAKNAIRCGADAVVVGSAITRPEHITSWFVRALQIAVGSDNK